MTITPNIAVHQQQNHYILYHATASSKGTCPFNVQLFDAHYLQQQQLITGTAQGRGTTYFFKPSQESTDNGLVLRHYLRGGLIANISNDHYLWTGLKHTRAYRELQILIELYQKGLAVAKPFAARVVRRGFLYSADIITYVIPDTITLVQQLSTASLDAKHWRTIGESIAAMHQHRVYHDDLNANNILINNQQQCFVIDFDKALIKHSTNLNWRDNNLQRLLRSLKKEQQRQQLFYFHDTDWEYFIEGYRTAIG